MGKRSGKRKKANVTSTASLSSAYDESSSKRKSGRSSKRKSVRSSKRKSGHGSRRKSVRKSERSSKRKSGRSSKRKSERKPRRSSRRSSKQALESSSDLGTASDLTADQTADQTSDQTYDALSSAACEIAASPYSAAETSTTWSWRERARKLGRGGGGCFASLVVLAVCAALVYGLWLALVEVDNAVEAEERLSGAADDCSSEIMRALRSFRILLWIEIIALAITGCLLALLAAAAVAEAETMAKRVHAVLNLPALVCALTYVYFVLFSMVGLSVYNREAGCKRGRTIVLTYSLIGSIPFFIAFLITGISVIIVTSDLKTSDFSCNVMECLRACGVVHR